MSRRSISLQRALFLLIALAILGGLVPAALVLDGQLASALEERARADLAVAPRLLADREAMSADALTMHAMDVAAADGLAEALENGDRRAAIRLAGAAVRSDEESPVLVRGDGELWAGSAFDSGLVSRLRDGAPSTAAVVPGSTGLRRVALVPVTRGERFLGAAGVSTALDRGAAGTIAGLTRSEVTILTRDGTVSASTAGDEVTGSIVDSASAWRGDGQVHALGTPSGKRYLVACAELGTSGTVAFARDLDAELAVVPELRRVAGIAGLSALLIAVALGGALAVVIARPVRSLAGAADRLRAGDFETKLPGSAIREVHRLSRAFAEMRRALSARLSELQSANRELTERQRRLRALQGELIRRDRLASSGRLVVELAHEIRNPVANVQNCLEVVRRRLESDPEGREFADMAIDELLRMHELAERMLDLHRPGDGDRRACDAAAVLREVASLVHAGTRDKEIDVESVAEEDTEVSIPPDALKQVLLNIVQNARDAVGDQGRIELRLERDGPRAVIEVRDDGPGIPPEILPNVFDPFFTTKSRVQGVGLGLFVAEGIVSAHGGRIQARNRTEGSGACFRIELMTVDADPSATRDERKTATNPG